MLRTRVSAMPYLIRHIKIKHADFNDREYPHVQYLGEDRHITGRKLWVNGRQFLKRYRAA